MDRQAHIVEAVWAWNPNVTIQSIEPLAGGMSAEMFLVGLLDRTLVARFPSPYVRELFEDAASQEFRTLVAARSLELPVPSPLFLGSAPDGNFLLLEYLDGKATANPMDPADFVGKFAMCLASIHKADISSGCMDHLLTTRSQYAPRRDELCLELGEPKIVEVLVQAGDQILEPRVLRHGDFWPGNILWQGDDITGIVDWEAALIGPAISDLAISRLDIFWILGRDAMEKFTFHYLRLNPISTEALYYWDLRAALRPMPNLKDWAGPYASLGRPDITTHHLETVLMEFIADAMAKV